MTSTPRIAICVATFKRPKGLARLLENLGGLERDGIQLLLIVADNDADESARDVVEGFAESMPFPVTYVVERARGIVSARNRLVAEARAADAEYIAFVDDDETVDPAWLKKLFSQLLASNADVVAGPQIFQFDDDVPDHVRSGLELRQFPSGTPVGSFSTGNVLIRTAALDEVEGPFDSRFNLTGGEDMFLGATLHSLGYTIVYCQEALVYEYVPKTRANMKWVLQRGYRSGTGHGRMALFIDPSFRSIGDHLVKSLGRIAVGLLLLPKNLLFDRASIGQNLRRVTTGIGGLAILLSPKAIIQEYKTTHGV